METLLEICLVGAIIIIALIVVATLYLRKENSKLKEENTKLREETASLKGKLREAKKLATLDCLTRIYNRFGFEVELKQLWERAQREEKPVSIIFMDLNGFKKVNDTFGHDAGDACLKAAADVLLKNKRAYDVAARLGGDEFVIILPDTDMSEAEIVAERVRLSMREKKIYGAPENVKISVSIGVSSGIPGKEYTNSASLCKEADDKMYAEKNKQKAIK